MLSESHLKDLEKNGYCVVEKVISKRKCNQYISKIWKWLENLDTGLKRKNKKTWTAKNWPVNTRGIIHNYNAGHAQFVWDLRSEDNIIQAFTDVWKTDKLLVSFDGFNVMRPGYVGTGKSWYHVDQGPKKKGKHCVQGFVTFEDTDEDDGTLMLYKKSHLYHQKMFKKNKHNGSEDWYKLTIQDLKWVKNNKLKEIKVKAPKGSLVLWDSRMIHCNKPPDKDRKHPNRFRYVVYVCMTPANKATEANYKKKKEALKDLRTTSHWPHHIKVFPKAPRFKDLYNEATIDNTIPILTERAKKLAGLVKY